MRFTANIRAKAKIKTKILETIAIPHLLLDSSGGNPVLGKPGDTAIGDITTTVADETSEIVKPFALPVAVPIFVVVWVMLVIQVK